MFGSQPGSLQPGSSAHRAPRPPVPQPVADPPLRAMSSPEESDQMGAAALYQSGSHPVYGTSGVGEMRTDRANSINEDSARPCRHHLPGHKTRGR